MSVDILNNKKIRKLLDERFKKNNILFEHLNNSYNDMLYRLTNYLETTNGIFEENKIGDKIYRYYFKFENIRIRPALDSNGTELLYPMDARLQNLNYSLKLIAKITQYQEIYDLVNRKIESTQIIGEVAESETLMMIPIMVKSKACSTTKNNNMLNSKECIFDTGGYFIIKGKEKNIIPKERMVENKVLVFKKKEGTTANMSEIYEAKINSKSDKSMVQQIKIKIKKNLDIMINVPILNDVSVFVLLRALGLNSDLEIVNCITQNNLQDTEMINILQLSIELSKVDGKKMLLTTEDAVNSLINKIKVKEKYGHQENYNVIYAEKKEYLKFLLEDAFLPHIENSKYDNPLRVKGMFLCYMVNKLLSCYLGRRDIDDRDSFLNKRIDMAGDVLYEEIINAHKKNLKDCNKIFFKRTQGNHVNPPNIINQIKSNIVHQSLINLLSKGESGNKTGISQPLQRTTFYQTITFLRRVDSVTSNETTSKLTGPRHYNSSQVGFLDAVESPEHAPIGLVKHLTMMSSITINQKLYNRTIYEYILSEKDFIHINNYSTINYGNNYTKIFINGEWIGCCLNFRLIYNNLKKMKTEHIIHRTIGIVYDSLTNEIRVNTESGRIYRELLKVDNNKLNLTTKILDEILELKNDDNINKWDLLLIKYPNTVDTIDAEEQFYSVICENQDELIKMREREDKIYEDTNQPIINRYDESYLINYTHCEIHPCCLMGILSNSIPFANHNQGPRNIYQFAQGKQAMGIYATNYRYRFDIAYILYNTQKPLVNSFMAKYSKSDVMPCGENAIVMIGLYTGLNIEDSLIFNKTSVDRGLFRSSTFKIFESKIDKNQSSAEDGHFSKPDLSRLSTKKYSNYDKLNEYGYVPEETEVNNNDVLICKLTPSNKDTNDKYYKDNSEIFKGFDSAIVDRVLYDVKNLEGYKMIKMKTRSEKIPKIGDKFCCYTEDHEVMTFDGWKPINKITLEDKIACLKNGKELVYDNPIALQEYDIDDELYEINENVSLKVTKNHRMYVGNRSGENFTIKTAEEVYGKRYTYKKNVDEYNPTIKHNILKYDDNNKPIGFILEGEETDEIIIDINIWCIIFGIWIAEGSVEKADRKVGGYRTTYATDKQRVKEILDKCLKKINIGYNVRNENRTDAYDDNLWYICNRNIGKYLYSLNIHKAHEKYLPDWTKYLTQEQCKILIHGMMLGDGHVVSSKKGDKYDSKALIYDENENIMGFDDSKNKGRTRRYDTSSYQLVKDFQQLCLHAGYATYETVKYEAGHETEIKSGKNEGNKIVARYDAYRINIIECQTTPLVNKNKEADGTNQQDRYVPFKGKVYCCTVPDDGIIYIKRNGVVVWCGQSRNGQKGTVGLLLHASDMPFTADGIIPDIILNTHAIPSRMTIGQLVECLLGKASILEYHEGDGTAFEPVNYEEIENILEKHGYERDGTEVMYNGFSGQKFKTKIFIGPTYYQRLKHLVNDKVHAVAVGSTVLKTRQPTEGRSKDGGFRIGEMERDALIAHGMATFLRERLVDTSDIYETHICDICGLFAKRIVEVNSKPKPMPYDKFECINCKNKFKISKVIIPYAFKLLCQELMALNIAPRIRTNNY